MNVKLDLFWISELMATVAQVQRRQNIQMAEGYLELATVLDGELTLDFSLRKSLAERAFGCLSKIKNPLGHKPYILFLKGQACRTADRFVDAIRYLDQSAKLDSENLHTYLALAWCHKRTRRLDLAIEAMQLAVELDSDCAIAHYNLACYSALDHNIDQALMHLTFALDLNDEYRLLVATESDFDGIRENPRFSSLTTVVV